ncbi:unnamed protein product [Victoria cruziana]
MESFAMSRDRLLACTEKGLSKLSCAMYLHRIGGQAEVKRGAVRILEEAETACADRAHVCGGSNGLPRLQLNHAGCDFSGCLRRRLFAGSFLLP